VIENHPKACPSIGSRDYPLDAIILAPNGASTRPFQEELGKLAPALQGAFQYL
jgi:hypothetical protein